VSEVGTGAVYDRGYRPYDGPRGGRNAARLALYRASMRRALGLRRPWRQKVAPFVLLGLAIVPAIVNVGVAYLTRDTPADRVTVITYREYVGVSSYLLVFVALTAPDLLCPDRRQRVLPLYFSRPLTGIDYIVAKVGAMATILFAFGFIPQLVLYVGQLLVSQDGALNYLTGHLDVLWKVPIAVALLALFFAIVGMALSSVTARRITAGAIIVGLFLVTSVVSAVLIGEDDAQTSTSDTGSFRPRVVQEEPGSYAALINVWTLPLQLRDLVFVGHTTPSGDLNGVDGGGAAAVAAYVAVVLAAAGTLFVRYDEVER
jgi:ABC-2 type transport system permease protein